MTMQPPAAGSERPTALQHALVLVEVYGLRIVRAHYPLFGGGCSCEQPDCDSIGKHPVVRGWPLTATSDQVEVHRIFELHPRCNYGLLCGIAGGLIVLDIDGPEGFATLAAWEAQHGPLPPAPRVRTGRGEHRYFLATCPIKNTAGDRGRGLGPGLDVRGEGGFVIGPGSLHASGHFYGFIEGYRPAEVPQLHPLQPDMLVVLADALPPPRAADEVPTQSYTRHAPREVRGQCAGA